MKPTEMKKEKKKKKTERKWSKPSNQVIKIKIKRILIIKLPDEADRNERKKKQEPRKSKSKWSNQKKRIVPSDAEKQRAERARPIMRREKKKKKKPRTQLQMPKGMMRREKKFQRWGRESEAERMRDIQDFREAESLISESQAWDDRWECLGGIWILSTVWNKSRTGSL